MKLCFAMCLLLSTAILQASALPAFDIHDWPIWAQAQWGHVRHHFPQAMSVSVINRSSLETDNAQLIEADSLDDVESAGVPTKAFELWFNHQLRDLGLYELTSSSRARFQLEIIILEYQPVFTANGPAGFWRDTKSSFVRWYQDWQEPGLATRLSLSARLTDTQTGVTTSYSTYIQAPQCQRLNVAAGFPPGVQSQFFEHWSRSLIGQTSIASMNRLLHWLMPFTPDLERQFQVSKVLGSRLEFQNKDAAFTLGDELLIHHKDDHREIGKAKIVRQRGDTFVAYPLTMHPAAVTQGDYVRVMTKVPELIRFPARIMQSNQCTMSTMEPTLALNQLIESQDNAMSHPAAAASDRTKTENMEESTLDNSTGNSHDSTNSVSVPSAVPEPLTKESDAKPQNQSSDSSSNNPVPVDPRE